MSLVRAVVPADRLLVDHTGTPARRMPPDTVLPPDPVAVPEVATVSVGAGTTITVPDALLFARGSAALAPDADAALRPVAEQLAPTAPCGFTGHSADFGDAAHQRDISERRAAAVAARLAAARCGPRPAAHGGGSTEPAVRE